jgi:hypothetical protein
MDEAFALWGGEWDQHAVSVTANGREGAKGYSISKHLHSGARLSPGETAFAAKAVGRTLRVELA